MDSVGSAKRGRKDDVLDAVAASAEGGSMNGCEFCGYANRTAGKTLHIVEETEPRIFINMQGSGYIQIFDEEYPGFVDGFYVNYCPMCGARLRSGYVGGEPPKEE